MKLKKPKRKDNIFRPPLCQGPTQKVTLDLGLFKEFVFSHATTLCITSSIKT